ncbi:MAG: hypothetical protein H7X88_05920 [Gloeobacteraceae cyanobacterium ES-bin-316]|nr:hypothetical protein [Ferruginibacter sp.]
MSDDLKNILSNLNKDIEQDKLLEYLNRQLSQQEQHDLETQLNDDAFMSDAMDGLEALNTNADLPMLVKELNSGLKKQLDQKKKRRPVIAKDSWIYYSIIIILILVILGFIVVKMMVKNEANISP